MTPAHLQALFEIEHGANVFDDGLAQLLWEVHEADPDLLQILDHAAMRGVPGFVESDLVDDHGKPCHFGAILKPKGVELLQRKRADARLKVVLPMVKELDPVISTSPRIDAYGYRHTHECDADRLALGQCVHDKATGERVPPLEWPQPEIIQSAMQDDLPNEPAFQPPTP